MQLTCLSPKNAASSVSEVYLSLYSDASSVFVASQHSLDERWPFPLTMAAESAGGGERGGGTDTQLFDDWLKSCKVWIAYSKATPELIQPSAAYKPNERKSFCRGGGGGGVKSGTEPEHRGTLTNPIMTGIMIVCSRYSHLTPVSLALPLLSSSSNSPPHSLSAFSFTLPSRVSQQCPGKLSKLCGFYEFPLRKLVLINSWWHCLTVWLLHY